MLEHKKWKKIPDRMQNAYSLMRKFSQKRMYKANPLKLGRQKLPPLLLDPLEPLSQSALTGYNSSPKKEDQNICQDLDEGGLIKDEIDYLIKSSLTKYPKLENYIRKLQKEKISCKCSVFSKSIYHLDRIHGFSSVACASEFCINRILEEPEDQQNNIIMKSPDYYSLIPSKTERKEANKDLILYEHSLDNITKAVNYINSNKDSEKLYTNLYSEYIQPPKSFDIPRHANLSPNFSVPKPRKKNYLS
jgi:hypothetical protein